MSVMSNVELARAIEESENGDFDICYRIGEHFYGCCEYEKAFEWYRKAADCKNVDPIVYFNIGYAYQHGEGVPCDLREAFLWYQKAAECKVPQALYNLAYFFQNGLGTPINEGKADDCMKQATDEMSRQQRLLYKMSNENNRLQKELEETTVRMQEQEKSADRELQYQRETADKELRQQKESDEEILRVHKKSSEESLQEMRQANIQLRQQNTEIKEKNESLRQSAGQKDQELKDCLQRVEYLTNELNHFRQKSSECLQQQLHSAESMLQTIIDNDAKEKEKIKAELEEQISGLEEEGKSNREKISTLEAQVLKSNGVNEELSKREATAIKEKKTAYVIVGVETVILILLFAWVCMLL